MKNFLYSLFNTASLIICIVCSLACSAFGQFPQKLPIIPRSINDNRPDAIMSAANAVVFPFWAVDTVLFKSKDPLKKATLTQQDMKKVDSLLIAVQRAEGIGFRHYFHQLIAAVNSQNHKLVYVNALCRADNGEEWKTNLYQVKGGGTCFYKVLLNLTTSHHSSFSINAPK